MKVKDKVILVTGGGNGLGRELVLNLLSKGAKVITIDINEAALEETALLAGSKSSSLNTLVVDITNKVSVEEFINKAIAYYGFVDGIINNAGIIQPFLRLNDLGYEAIERVINVNLYGTLYITKGFLPHLLSRAEGHIVNISSMGGFLPVPGQTVYGATKAAVKLLTEGLNSELKSTNVKVMVVFPGAIHTNIMGNSGLVTENKPLSKTQAKMFLSPVKAAELIVNGMENDRYRLLLGKDSKFFDLYYRLNPKSAAAFISEKMKGLLNN